MTKEERIALAKQARDAAIDNAILEMKSEDDHFEETVQFLHNAVKKSIMNLLGCEYSFGEFQIKRDSLLKQKVDTIISSVMETIEFQIPELTDKEKNTIQKIFVREYKSALKEQCKEIAWKFAEKDLMSIVEGNDAN